MATRPTKMTRKALVNYAALLGPNSIAADVLRQFDEGKAAKRKGTIYRTNNSFKVEWQD